MGHPERIYYTAGMVRALNERVPEHTPRYETVHGELLVMRAAPRPIHQRVVTRLLTSLDAYLQRERVGEVFTSPSEISWGLEDVLVQPDVFVVPAATSKALQASGQWAEIRHLLLAVEILTPSSKRQDRFTKRRLYQERGVPLYWIIDPQACVAEVWTPSDTFPRFERERLTWQPAGARRPFEVELPDLFEPPGA